MYQAMTDATSSASKKMHKARGWEESICSLNLARCEGGMFDLCLQVTGLPLVIETQNPRSTAKGLIDDSHAPTKPQRHWAKI